MQNVKINIGKEPAGKIAVAADHDTAKLTADAVVSVLKYAGYGIAAQSAAVSTVSGFCTYSITFDTVAQERSAAVILGESALCYTFDFLKKYNTVILPYNKEENKDLPQDQRERLVTFSHDDDRASLVAKNIMENENFTSFELLGTGIIGRIKLKKESGLTVETALALAGALLAAGIPLHVVTGGLSGYSGEPD